MLLTPDKSLNQRLALRYQLMLILVVLYFYGRGLAPKGRVYVLGGRDVFDNAQRASSFLLQISIKIFIRGVALPGNIQGRPQHANVATN